MPLDLPSHLAGLTASPPAVNHTWEPGDSMVAKGDETPALLKNIGELSLRAVLGLQASLNEWVAQRFRHLNNDPEFTWLIEAVWAASIDYRYLKIAAMNFSPGDGPVGGPIIESKMLSKRICKNYGIAEFGTVCSTIASAHLVKYVLPDSKPFQSWFKTVVQRLPALSQPSARVAGKLDVKLVKAAAKDISPEVFGTPVPREAYDPAFDLSTADPAALIDAMLVRIASRPNPYLHTAEELAQAGFPGTPYRYPS